MLFKNRMVAGIPEPVIDLMPVYNNVYALTVNGDVYFAKEKDTDNAKLLASGITAIADTVYSDCFVSANQKGEVLVYDARTQNTKPIKAIALERGRISELAVYGTSMAVKVVNCGTGYFTLPGGRPHER